MSATEDAAPGRGAAKITRVSTADYQWKRARPITNGLHTYTTSDMTVVKIETDVGVTGYGVGRPRPGERELRASFLATLVGRDPTMTEAIWASLWSPKLSGRRGYETRALSSIDLALWDIKAKLANMPLYKLLGGYRTRIPFYIAGGYYSEGKGFKELQQEVESYVALGAKAVKMKIGAVPIKEDIARIKAVREAIGPDVKLLMDANCAYRYYDAIQLAQRAEEYEPFWFEEPVQPDDYDGFRKIAAATSIPIATGENEYTKHGFRDLIATQAVAILNPDARYMGGVTEFMKVAAMAQAHGLDICPHGDQQAHLHLLAAIPNARLLEFYPKKVNAMAGEVYLHPPALNDDGTVTVSDLPGIGLDPNEEALAPHRIG
ncbi:L-alanine-DL-glutamate epimerase-like enolase superfamily enzyme [Inquilinus ginsengisoli]|uniref:L-alanine-DL-glutamate epimerase-like enolase superfamily enzyme n=1 Tax=Inquilinus ginsengisoli TaxID=363840 RepID=A0ABU1JIJ9_9PROT|nr:mandelate racemase/muconate lactonizing enzyme family protein [Inquilinus ginsengisoli]MDR6288437.1 L-alanine-DL-glutamate epimerase-like enolase superfamily enzyme [Inquilinus ginsengisoli]